MSAQVYSLLGQTERGRKAFRRGKAYIYPLNYLLHMRVMLTTAKSIHRPLSTLPVGIGNTQVVFKTNQ